MPWYAWVVIAYVALDRLTTVAWVGRSIEITHGVAIASLVSGSLIVWSVLTLAGAA